jgi:hypothetical protein
MTTKTFDPAAFHQLYGPKQPRVNYYAKDFGDYTLMILLTAALLVLAYGPLHVLSLTGLGICAFLLAAFVIRHGVQLRVPAVVRQPQEILYSAVYKLRNVPLILFVGVGVLLLENVAIRLTPGLPHRVEWMRTGALWLFYAHLALVTLYRTAILVEHLSKRELVREVLMQTPWKRVINDKTNILLEIVHAYATGLVTHIVLMAPWYLVIRYLQFSLVFMPLALAASVLVHRKWLRTYNRWYYRDHWLAHNSEFEFLFLHGPHHDAIPSGLIAVADNGILEGFLRYTLGSPVAFYSPLLSFFVFTTDIKADIDLHQYIPGVRPTIPRRLMGIYQHSTHHYGRLEPYGMAMSIEQDPGVNWKRIFRWLPPEVLNSFKIDEELTGTEWNNPTHLSTLRLYDKYAPAKPAPAPAAAVQPEQPAGGLS